MARQIAHRVRTPNGWRITVVDPEMYVRGDGSFEAGERAIEVAHADLRGRGRDEVLDVLAEAMEEDPVGQVLGDDVVRPALTRALAERSLEAPYARWRRWQATRQEAQARGMAAGVLTALQQAEDAAWGAYVQAIQRWRAAP
jgi:hypothetical protein